MLLVDIITTMLRSRDREGEGRGHREENKSIPVIVATVCRLFEGPLSRYITTDWVSY